jgi:hypothetical protein
MKFNFFMKTCFFVMLLISIEAISAGKVISVNQRLQNNLLKKTKLAPNSYRFQDYDKMNQNSDKNMILLNSEVLNGKPPTDIDDNETAVWPESANAGSEYRWTFLWWTLMHFPAGNAIRGDRSYWLSDRGRQHDHWEAVFSSPTKIDVMEINWRLPPKRFRVFYKVEDKSDYLPITDLTEKTSFINKEGRISSTDAISQSNAVVFHKPIFAKRIRINLNEPVKSNSFSITSVKFFQKKTTILIKNELVGKDEHFCFYVNTNLPRENEKVEAYPCIKSLSMSNNNELWTLNNDSSIRHFNSRLCLGFDIENNLVIRNCGGAIRPSFTVHYRPDNSLYFKGYEDKCLVIDDSKKISENFLSEDTEVLVTTEADQSTFKKENMKFTGENIWHSIPGHKKATIQILFGKIKSGPHKGKFENKKIDIITISWVREPKKFMVYTWKPGYSWTLDQVYNNYNGKLSEISMTGKEAAAIMIVMKKPKIYPELGNIPAYAIKEVSVTYDSMKLKHASCSNFGNKLKVFDFDTQYYKKLEGKQDYENIRKKMSISLEKMIAGMVQIKNSLNSVVKARFKAQEFITKINSLRKTMSKDAIKKLRSYKSDVLKSIKNSSFAEALNNMKANSFSNSINSKKSGLMKIGTKDFPGIDCVQIKKLQRNSLSGWYYIKGDCNEKPIKVFCDFTVYGDAVDFYVFNDDNIEPNPDLSYLNIKDFKSVRYQCAKHGLHPLQIPNGQVVERVYQILSSMGYDLSKTIAVPLGYDYSCNGGKCNKIINSLNDKQTPVINSFFVQDKKSGQMTTPGPFAGIGFSNNHSMISFSPDNVKISALICSTNHFQTNSDDNSVKTLSCDSTVNSNSDIFSEGANILINCPSSCNLTQSKIYGTSQYHGSSSICKAAIHSNILGASGGKVFVRVGAPIKNYLGTASNGLKSLDKNGDASNTFSVLKYTPKCPIDQYQDLVKAENGENTSFIELENRNVQIKEKFEEDLNSNMFEGVDKEDIDRASERANDSNMSTMRIDDDSEINSNQEEQVNDSEQQTENSQPSELFEDNSSSLDDANSNLINDNSDSSLDSTTTSDSDINTEYKFSELEEERDKITTEKKSPTQQAAASANNLMKNINDASKKMVNQATSALKDIKKKEVPAAPVKPPTPKKGDKPPEPEPQPKKSAAPSSANTDDGNIQINKIRDSVDWKYLNAVKAKQKAVSDRIASYQKGIAWSQDGSKLSISFIKSIFKINF